LTVRRCNNIRSYRYTGTTAVAAGITSLEKAKLLPDWNIAYTNQSVMGWQLDKAHVEHYYGAGDRFSTVQVGVGIPIFMKAQRARIRAAGQMQAAAAMEALSATDKLWGQMQQYWIEYDNIKRPHIITWSVPCLLRTPSCKWRTSDTGTEILITSNGHAGKQFTHAAEPVYNAVKELNTRKIELEYLLQQN